MEGGERMEGWGIRVVGRKEDGVQEERESEGGVKGEEKWRG